MLDGPLKPGEMRLLQSRIQQARPFDATLRVIRCNRRALLPGVVQMSPMLAFHGDKSAPSKAVGYVVFYDEVGTERIFAPPNVTDQDVLNILQEAFPNSFDPSSITLFAHRACYIVHGPPDVIGKLADTGPQFLQKHNFSVIFRTTKEPEYEGRLLSYIVKGVPEMANDWEATKAFQAIIPAKYGFVVAASFAHFREAQSRGDPEGFGPGLGGYEIFVKPTDKDPISLRGHDIPQLTLATIEMSVDQGFTHCVFCNSLTHNRLNCPVAPACRYCHEHTHADFNCPLGPSRPPPSRGGAWNTGARPDYRRGRSPSPVPVVTSAKAPTPTVSSADSVSVENRLQVYSPTRAPADAPFTPVRGGRRRASAEPQGYVVSTTNRFSALQDLSTGEDQVDRSDSAPQSDLSSIAPASKAGDVVLPVSDSVSNVQSSPKRKRKPQRQAQTDPKVTDKNSQALILVSKPPQEEPQPVVQEEFLSSGSSDEEIFVKRVRQKDPSSSIEPLAESPVLTKEVPAGNSESQPNLETLPDEVSAEAATSADDPMQVDVSDHSPAHISDHSDDEQMMSTDSYVPSEDVMSDSDNEGVGPRSQKEKGGNVSTSEAMEVDSIDSPLHSQFSSRPIRSTRAAAARRSMYVEPPAPESDEDYPSGSSTLEPTPNMLGLFEPNSPEPTTISQDVPNTMQEEANNDEETQTFTSEEAARDAASQPLNGQY